MCNFDVDVGLLEGLGLIRLPDHVTLSGVGIKANPALELVIGRHCDGVFFVNTDSGCSVKFM